MSIFKPIKCGETLPPNNIHSISVSMPKLQDVVDYEEQTENIQEVIKSGYPRFVLHPYLKLTIEYIKKKYEVPTEYEVVVLNSKSAVQVVSDKYYIHNPFDFDEPFGVILVLNNTSQLQKVLNFIQYVGSILSSRYAEDYLLEKGVITKRHKEVLDIANISRDNIVEVLANGYHQPKQNVALATTGMNAIYATLQGIKSIQECNGRTILVQLGWLYLDTMNIVKHYFKDSKIFYDVDNLDELEQFLQKSGYQISAIITEFPTNPLLKVVDIVQLSKICKKYNIPLVVDSTFVTPYGFDLKPYADILVESLSKFASGSADLLMGAIIINENSKLATMKEEFFKHCDRPYIKDIQRLSHLIGGYQTRVERVSKNTKELVEFLQKKSFIKSIYFAKFEDDKYCGVISLEFKEDFQKVYDTLNFAKGPSLGTDFTLLMPYTYLAHYDYIKSEEGQRTLKQHNLPIDLLRISVGIEDINEIKREFEKLEL